MQFRLHLVTNIRKTRTVSRDIWGEHPPEHLLLWCQVGFVLLHVVTEQQRGP